MENKCEQLKIEHAWRSTPEMWGFQQLDKYTCANCGLTRTHHYETKESWTYSDGRPEEPIHNMKPV